MVHIKTETVGSRIYFASFRCYHAVVCSERVCKATAEHFRHVLEVTCDDAALLVDIKLSERHLGGQVDLSLISFHNWNRIRLIAARPNYEV